MKVANTLILSLLVVIAALLGALLWRQSHPATVSQAAITAPAASETAPSPAAEMNVPPAKPPMAAVPAPAPKTAAKSAHATKSMAKASDPPLDYTHTAQPVAPPPLPVAPPPPPAAPARASAEDIQMTQPMSAPAPIPPTPAKVQVNIPSGTSFTVRLSQQLSSDQLKVGDTFRGTLDAPIYFNSKIVIPRGTGVEGSVVDIQEAGKVKGSAQLTLSLTKVQLAGSDPIALQTDSLTRQGPSNGTASTEKIGGGSAIGAIIGAIAGGGKGAAIGAGAGAGAGTGAVLLGHGKPVVLTAETRLVFQSNTPVSFETIPVETDASNSAPPSQAQPSYDSGRPTLHRRPATANGPY